MMQAPDSAFGDSLRPVATTALLALCLLGCGGTLARAHLQTAVELLGKCDFAASSEAADDALLIGGSLETQIAALLVKATSARRLGDKKTADAIISELHAIDEEGRGELSATVKRFEEFVDGCDEVARPQVGAIGRASEDPTGRP